MEYWKLNHLHSLGYLSTGIIMTNWNKLLAVTASLDE
jgi:hypothetical protein